MLEVSKELIDAMHLLEKIRKNREEEEKNGDFRITSSNPRSIFYEDAKGEEPKSYQSNPNSIFYRGDAKD